MVIEKETSHKRGSKFIKKKKNDKSRFQISHWTTFWSTYCVWLSKWHPLYINFVDKRTLRFTEFTGSTVRTFRNVEKTRSSPDQFVAILKKKCYQKLFNKLCMSPPAILTVFPINRILYFISSGSILNVRSPVCYNPFQAFEMIAQV